MQFFFSVMWIWAAVAAAAVALAVALAVRFADAAEEGGRPAQHRPVRIVLADPLTHREFAYQADPPVDFEKLKLLLEDAIRKSEQKGRTPTGGVPSGR